MHSSTPPPHFEHPHLLIILVSKKISKKQTNTNKQQKTKKQTNKQTNNKKQQNKNKKQQKTKQKKIRINIKEETLLHDIPRIGSNKLLSKLVDIIMGKTHFQESIKSSWRYCFFLHTKENKNVPNYYYSTHPE